MSQVNEMLEEPILLTVRGLCNLESGDDSFDSQLIPLINSQLMVAHQFGVGQNGFLVTSEDETWQDLLGESGVNLIAIQSWLGFSVKLLFDPPDNASVLKSYQDQIQKFEWMLCSKSQSEGIVKQYVTEKQAEIYDDLYDYDDDDLLLESELDD